MNHHDAAGCIQEFCPHVDGDWLHSVDPERGHFRGWLLTTCAAGLVSDNAPPVPGATLVDQEVVDGYERPTQKVIQKRCRKLGLNNASIVPCA